MSQRWTIDELTDRVADALQEQGVVQESRRVSEAPSKRTIRYYATHGLVDKPKDFEGRTAIYGPRHLWQVVAVKRLQGRGLKLDEIQDRLAGATAEEIAEIAGAPGSLPETPESTDESDESDEAFWRQAPAPRAAAKRAPRAETADAETADDAGPRESAPARFDLRGIRLDEGVSLLLEGLGGDLDREDLEAIRAAAEPMVAELRERSGDEES